MALQQYVERDKIQHSAFCSIIMAVDVITYFDLSSFEHFEVFSWPTSFYNRKKNPLVDELRNS